MHGVFSELGGGFDGTTTALSIKLAVKLLDIGASKHVVLVVLEGGVIIGCGVVGDEEVVVSQLLSVLSVSN